MLDKKREMYEVLTPEEKAEFKASVRLFRHPKYAKNNGEFYQTSEEQMGYDSYSKAFKKYLKENYNISSFESNPLNDQSKSKKGHEKHENLGDENSLDKNFDSEPVEYSFSGNVPDAQENKYPIRRTSYKQDLLSKHNKNPIERVMDSNKPSDNKEVKHKSSSDKIADSNLQRGTAENLNIKKDDIRSTDDIDERVKAVQSPNPPSEWFAQSGVHYRNRKETMEDINLKKVLKYQKEEDDRYGISYGSDDEYGFHRTRKIDQTDSRQYKNFVHTDTDPFLVNKSNVSHENNSYLNRWQQNMKEKAENDKKMASAEYVPILGEFKPMLIIFVFVVTLLISATIGLGSHDVPIDPKPNASRESSDNKKD